MSLCKTIGQKCQEKFPDKVPIVVDYKGFSAKKPDYLVISFGSSVEFLSNIIRKRANIPYAEFFSLFIDDNAMASSDLLSDLYAKYKNASDDCLHLTVSKV